MLGLGRNGPVGVFARASSARNRDIYERYATGLYRLAFLTLGDAALAEHAVRDVIVGECALPPAAGHDEDNTRHRLAESVFRRCQQLAADPARCGRRPARPPSGTGDGCVDPESGISMPRGADQLKSRRKVMRTLGYVTAITMAAAGAALGVMAVRSLPDVRRYVEMRKM
jgi:hypothetical protein